MLALTFAFGVPQGALAISDEPIQIIVPTDLGGAIDGLARTFQKAFETTDLLAYSVPVINMAGAGGTISTRAIKDAAADGHSIGLWHDGIVTSKSMGVVDDDQSNFAVSGATGFADLGLAFSAQSEFSTFEEMIAHAKENPAAVTFAVNIGLPVHFVPIRVARGGDLDLRCAQVGGGAKRYQSLVGGHTDQERVAALPDTPTARECGIDVVAPSQRIWLAPKDVPADRLETLRSAFADAMAREAAATQLEAFGLNAVFVDADTVVERLGAARDATLPSWKEPGRSPTRLPLRIVRHACARHLRPQHHTTGRHGLGRCCGRLRSAPLLEGGQIPASVFRPPRFGRCPGRALRRSWPVWRPSFFCAPRRRCLRSPLPRAGPPRAS